MTAKPVQPQGLVGSLQSEVAAEASPLMLFLVAHARTIALGLVLFIVAIGGYWVYSWQSDKSRDAEARELGQLLIISDPALRLQKLEAYAPNAPASVKTALYFGVMQAASQLNDPQKTFEAWKAISDLDASVRPTAYLGMSGALSMQGKHKEALDLLAGAASGMKGLDSVNINGRILLLAESLGDYRRALAACDVLLGQELHPQESALWSQKRAELEGKIKAAGQAPAADASGQAPAADAASGGAPAQNATEGQ